MNPALTAEYDAAFDDLHRVAQRAAYVVLGDRDLACDVAQEVLYKAFQRWGRIRTYAPAWVTRVSTNQALSARRSTDRRTARERRAVGVGTSDNAPIGSGDPLPGATGRQQPDQVALRADLTEALRRLPRRQREVVVLRHLFGFSEAETAAAMGVSEGSVKSHSHRARAVLRERLGGDYFMEAAL